MCQRNYIHFTRFFKSRTIMTLGPDRDMVVAQIGTESSLNFGFKKHVCKSVLNSDLDVGIGIQRGAPPAK